METKRIISPRFLNDGKSEEPLSKIQVDGIKKFNEFIKKEGYYKKKISKCPLCNSDSFVLISEKDRYGFFYPTRICKKCGLVQANPYYDEASIKFFYENCYRKIYTKGTNNGLKLFFDGEEEKGRKIYEFLITHARLGELKDKKIIEVGCGAGGILIYFKKKGNEVRGIDMGGEHFTCTTKKELNLEKCSLKEFIQKNPNFCADIIIYSHVMEHIPNPLAEIDLIRKISNNETLIYVEVPGIYGIKRSYGPNFLDYLNNAHTFSFTLTSLKNLFNLKGYECVFGNEDVRSIFRYSGELGPIKFERSEEIIDSLVSLEKKYRKDLFKKQKKFIKRIHHSFLINRIYKKTYWLFSRNIKKILSKIS